LITKIIKQRKTPPLPQMKNCSRDGVLKKERIEESFLKNGGVTFF